jgi:hypothetical protein
VMKPADLSFFFHTFACKVNIVGKRGFCDEARRSPGRTGRR